MYRYKSKWPLFAFLSCYPQAKLLPQRLARMPLFQLSARNIFPEFFIKAPAGNSLVVQWLGLGAFTAEGTGSSPGGGTKIPHTPQCSQK